MRDLTRTQNELLAILKPNTEFIVLSTRTTGFDSSDKVIQFSAIKAVVKQDYSIEERDNVDIISNSSTEDVDFSNIESMLSCPIITGYNVGFDLRMINCMAKRQQYDFERKFSFDVLNLARDFLEKPKDVENFQLSTVVSALLGENTETGSAIADVRATMKLLEVLLGRYLGYIPPTETQTKLIKAKLSYDVVSKQKKRVSVKLSIGKDGDVYYDIAKKEWVLKPSVIDKVYLPSIIEQFRKMYMDPFGYATIEELIDTWFEYSEKNGTKKTAKKKA